MCELVYNQSLILPISPTSFDSVLFQLASIQPKMFTIVIAG